MILFALLAVLVVGFVLWRALGDGSASRSSESTEEGTRPTKDASLSGRAPRRVEEEPLASRPLPAEGLGGRVVDSQGTPVAGATVFLLPRSEPGRDEVEVSVLTTPTGAFRLPPTDLRGQWIGARGPAHGLAYQPGEEAEEGLVLVLPDGFPLTLDVGVLEPVEAPSVRLRVSGEGWLFPGPGERVGVDREVVVPVPGSVTLHLPSAAGVQVHPLEPGVAWSPAPLGAAELPATLRLEVSPSKRVAIVVEEGGTQEPYLGPGVARLFDLESGEEIDRIDGPAAAGRYVFLRGLRVRDHYVTFEAPDYRPWRSPRLKVREGGRPMLLRAHIVREQDVGDLLLDTPQVYRIAWRPAEAKDLPWQTLRPRLVDGRVLVSGLPVGRSHLILWKGEGESTQTALLEDVEIVGAASPLVGVAWRAGDYVKTSPGTSAIWQVTHPRLGTLPLVRPELPVVLGGPWPSADVGVDLEYGPYPVGDLVAEPLREVKPPTER